MSTGNSLAMMPFFPRDYLAATRAMRIAERGAYTDLLFFQWEMGELPVELDRLALLVGVPSDEFADIWKSIGKKFVRRGDGLINKRLEEHRVKAIYQRDSKVKGAHAANAIRDAKRSADGTQSVQLENAQRGAKHAFCATPPSPSPSPSPSQRNTSTPTPSPQSGKGVVLDSGSGEEGARRTRGGSRALGTNPRAVGANPKAAGTNPRALGTNPRADRDARNSEMRAAEAVWERLIATDGKDRDSRSDAALRSIGGWQAWKMRTAADSQSLRRRFLESYRDSGESLPKLNGHQRLDPDDWDEREEAARADV